MGWKKEYKAVGQSLAAGSKALGEWKVADMTIGLSYLAEKRAEDERENPELRTKSLATCEKVTAKEERLRTLEWACDLAEIAYIGQESVLRKLLLQEMDLTLVHGEVESKFSVPAHYWAYNKDKKVCVFAVRGTASTKDMLTDLDSIAEDLTLKGKGGGSLSGKVHRGMMQSAKALCEKVSTQLQDLSKEGFEIFVVGHSLGAGTATLLSILLKTEYDIDNLTCFGIATPPVADQSLCEASKGYITSLVCQDDIVCRLSVANINRLNQELLDLPWLSMVASDLTETKVGAMAEYMGVKIGETKTRVTGAKTFQQASEYGKKAVGKMKPKIGSLTNFATDKMSKVKIGFGSIGRKKSNAQAPKLEGEIEETKEEATTTSDGQQPDGENINAAKAEEVSLLPPGKLIYLSRTGGGMTRDDSEDEDEDEDEVEADSSEGDDLAASVQAFKVDQTWEGLSRIELSKTMLKDHYLTSYFDNLKMAMDEPVEMAQVVLSTRMSKLEAGKKALLGLAEWKEREVSLLKLRRKHLVVQYVSGKSGKKKNRQVALDGAHVSRMKGIKERPFAFAIEAPDQTIKLDPNTEQEMNKWLAALGEILPLH